MNKTKRRPADRGGKPRPQEIPHRCGHSKLSGCQAGTILISYKVPSLKPDSKFAPENGWLEDELSLKEMACFQGRTVSFREYNMVYIRPF